MPAKSFEEILKFNPYHDAQGRFSTADAATLFTYAPGKSTAHDKAISRAKEAEKGFKGTLYHGSPATDIEEFDMSRAGQNTSSGEKLLYFTDSKQLAEDFSYERLEGSTKYMQRRGKKGRVYEVEVEMKNPLDLRNLSDKDVDNILKLDVEGILTREVVQELLVNHQLLKTSLDLRAESLKKLGYDGLIANTGKAGHNSIEYAVVDSKQAKIRKSIAKSFADILKGNPWHDPTNGRFTTGPGGSAYSASLQAEKDKVLAMKPNEQALYVWEHDGETEDNCIDAMNNGQTEALVNNYFAIMEANGDPTPTNPTSDQLGRQLQNDVESGKYPGYTEARIEYIKSMSGLSDAEASETLKEMEKWFGGSWTDADTGVLDKYIENDHVYEGTMYRGMKFDHEGFDSFMKNVSPGAEISMKRNSSWSSDEDVARRFGAHIYDDVDTVMITCVKNKTSAPVEHLSTAGEAEVLASSNAKWTVLHSEIATWPSGAKKAYITVVEKE